jgi:hypothetical protein
MKTFRILKKTIETEVKPNSKLLQKSDIATKSKKVRKNKEFLKTIKRIIIIKLAKDPI